MINYQDMTDQRPYYQPRFVPLKMDATLKIDEGYSEDTRSQDDTDSPMRMDSMGDGALSQTWSSAAGVPHQIMSLSEAERSGKCTSVSQ